MTNETAQPTNVGSNDQLGLVAERAGFTPSELMLGYNDWKPLSEARLKHLLPDVRAWLHAWKRWDLACSPMDDNERRLIRYGHYLGWWEHGEHKKATAETMEEAGAAGAALYDQWTGKA